MKKVVVFGNGKIAAECLKLLTETQGVEIRLVLYNPNDPSLISPIRTFCEKHSIHSEAIGSTILPSVTELIREKNPDIIFNINSHNIFDKKILDIPKIGAINFHNGPLPKYRGPGYVIPSWAIFNQEHEHGVTWHFMDEGIDTGDIIAQDKFYLSNKETALELNFKCITAGIKLFEKNIDDILSDNCNRTSQKGPSSTYFSSQIPNNGYIDFNWPYHKIDAFLRATDYRPYQNLFTYAKVKYKNNIFIVNTASLHKLTHHNYQNGEIISLSSNYLRIAANDSILDITKVMHKEDDEISIEKLIKDYHISEGDVLNYNYSDKFELAS